MTAMRRLPIILCMALGYGLGVLAQGPTPIIQQGPIVSGAGGGGISSISSGSCGATVGVQSITSAGVVTCWAATTFAAATGPHTITGADAASSLIFPTITYTSNMSAVPLISIIATENTGAGTHDYLKMAITRTAGEYNYVNFLGGVAGSTSEMTVDRNGSITNAGDTTSLDFIGNPTGSSVGAFQTAAALAANVRAFNTTGTRATSNTGTNAISAWDLAHTLNTSGVPSVFKLAVTDTAHGANTLLMQILGGVAAATNEFSVDTSGNVNSVGQQIGSALQCSSTAPTIASGFGTGATIPTGFVSGLAPNNCQFEIYVGSTASSSGVITLPTPRDSWWVECHDYTTTGNSQTKFFTQQTTRGATTATITNLSYTNAPTAWVSNDRLLCQAKGS